jgi:hypothetical protein
MAKGLATTAEFIDDMDDMDDDGRTNAETDTASSTMAAEAKTSHILKYFIFIFLLM